MADRQRSGVANRDKCCTPNLEVSQIHSCGENSGGGKMAGEGEWAGGGEGRELGESGCGWGRVEWVNTVLWGDFIFWLRLYNLKFASVARHVSCDRAF